MAKKVNLSNKGFQFFLSGSKIVESLEVGAKLYGGATKFDNKVVSNVENGDFVTISDKNVLKVFVPSTVNVNGSASFDIIKENLDYVRTIFDRHYLSIGTGKNLQVTETKGSWFSDDNNCVVYDDIIIVSIDVETVTNFDIKLLKMIAGEIKKSMSQEGVSIMVNEALAIV